MEKVYALFYTLFSWAEKLHFLHCSGLFFHFWLLRSFAIYHCKNIIKNGTKPISFRCHFLQYFSSPLHPGYDSQKHHLPWKHFWPKHTWKKNSSPPLWKKWCPCVPIALAMECWCPKRGLTWGSFDSFLFLDVKDPQGWNIKALLSGPTNGIQQFRFFLNVFKIFCWFPKVFDKGFCNQVKKGKFKLPAVKVYCI